MRPCPSCSIIVEVGQETVLCSGCGLKHHARCAALSEGEDIATWRCSNCRGSAAPSIRPPSLAATTAGTEASLNQTHFEILMKQLSLLQNGIAENNHLIQAQSAKIVECIADITDLKTENEFLKNKISQLECSLENLSLENAYKETVDRIDRERNLIVNGINENCSPQNVQDLLCKIFEDILPQRQINIVSTSRLGKSGTARQPRPVKVRFANSEDPLSVLKNKSKLDKQKYPQIRIKPDLTKNQLQHLDNLYKELNERKANGEGNLFIRYIKRQPVIFQSGKGAGRDTLKRTREESFSPMRIPGAKVPNVDCGVSGSSPK